MKEKIIFASGINGSELMICLARHGVNCFNTRVCDGTELARMALLRSGISISEEFIGFRETNSIIARLVSGDPYFGKASLSDVQAIAGAIHDIRHLTGADHEEETAADVLEKGLFAEKNEALANVCREYVKKLKEDHLIDATTLIRRAAQECKDFEAEFVFLEEYPPTALEQSLIDQVSGHSAEPIRLCELFGFEGDDEGLVNVESYRNCFGAPNEIEMILTDIYSGKPLDQCTIAITDTVTYSQLLFDYATQYNIPISFGCGIPIINSNPARLLSLYYRWMTGEVFGASSTADMLTDEAFNRKKLYDKETDTGDWFHWNVFVDLIGTLRFSNDRLGNRSKMDAFKRVVTDEEVKAYIPLLERASEELALPPEEFIQKYAYLRQGEKTITEKLLSSLDRAAASVIYEDLQTASRYATELSLEDVIVDTLGKNICRQRSEEGKIHATEIRNAAFSIRENLFIAGMAASKYPGSPRENYLLLDSDLKLFGSKAEEFTSEGVIKGRRKQFMRMIRLASSLDAKIYISYPGLDVSELKRDNASSLIYELLKTQRGSDVTSKELDKAILKVDYFEPSISLTKHIGEKYNQGVKLCVPSEEETDNEPVGWDLEKYYSPSALDIFFNCPRQFMLRSILGIPVQEEENSFQIISAAEAGILVHALMEDLANSSMDPETFLKLSEKRFDQFIAEHPPLIADQVAAAKTEFLEMMETAYEMDPHRKVILKEEDIQCLHNSGVKIHGYPDRVEKLDDGTCLIVDFKTGRTIKHVQDDVDTCLQVLIYAYLMESLGEKVSGCEYRYIRRNSTVSCRYDEEMKQKLTEKLNTFKDHMQKGNFPIAKATEEDEDPCKYCTFDRICGKYAPEEANEEEPEEAKEGKDS